MSRHLAQLAGKNDSAFIAGLKELESVTNLLGTDAKLIGEIFEKAHSIIRKMGLDGSDSTAKEIYYALLEYTKNANNHSNLVDADFVLYSVHNEIISFNLIDIVENLHHQLKFEDRIVSHGQRALRGELISRYKNLVSDSSRIDEKVNRFGLLKNDDNHHVTLSNYKKHITGSKRPVVVTIGDIVTDAFIKLRDDQAEVSVDDKGIRRLSMEFGSKPPYDHVDIIDAVGNSANAAVSIARLGLNASLMAFIGNDQAGRDSLAYLAKQGVDTSLVSVQEGQKTNYHYALRYGADRTILIKYENYNYSWQDPEFDVDWLYLSMISKDAWHLHQDMMKYLETKPNTKLVFQPGTFHFEWGKEKLASIYKRTHLIVMNREEASLVTGLSLDSIVDLLDGLHKLGPNIVVVTDGPKGSYASDDSGKYFVPNYPDIAPPFDRTGAGDAFASTIVGALAMGEDLQTALLWAPINSMSVVQKLGAQAGLLNKKQIKEYLDKAPDDYKIKEIN